MLLRIQHYDFRFEEIAEASREEAVRTFQRLDWVAELTQAQEARQRGFQVCTIGMELMDDTGSRLFLSPIDRHTICFNYVYPCFRSEFGLGRLQQEEEKFVACYPIDALGRLISLHYRSERSAILQIEAEESRPGLTWRADGSGSGRP